MLAAGSIGTTELLMRARRAGSLPNLNERVVPAGHQRDATTAWWWNPTGGLTQGAAPRSLIRDVFDGLPMTLENWFVPGFPVDLGILGSLVMSLDDQRADFTLTPSGSLALTWPGQPTRRPP